MKKPVLQERPAYMVESVDNVLRLIQLLRDSGTLRVTDAARELDIALSTAHRLFSMLVYRGFAVQDAQRRYVPGPAMDARAVRAPWTRRLRDLASAPMHELSDALGETVNLMIRVGPQVRFLSTVEGPAVLRVGDRTGAVVPASAASGGKAMLALEPADAVRGLYTGTLSTADLTALEEKLDAVRTSGVAVNREESEDGVGAVGAAVTGRHGAAIAAISVACPIARLPRLLAPDALARIRGCAAAISALAANLDTTAD